VASTKSLVSKVTSLANAFDENFLELAETLAQLHENNPEEYARAVKNSDVGKRKAYYLLNIARQFKDIPVPKHRLQRIGWTKLIMIGKQIDKTNYEELIDKAESFTAKQLEAYLAGQKPLDKSHVLNLYFSPQDYTVLADALVAHGASRSGRGGLANKEEALISLIKSAQSKSK
jgi:hypothetical protein